MYYFESPIRFSEVDEAEYLRYGQIIDYFQDTSSMADAQSYTDSKRWGDKGIVWVLSAWDIYIHQRPSLGDCIKVGTKIVSHKHCFVDRYYDMALSDESKLAEGMALWTALSKDTYLPVKLKLDLDTDEVHLKSASRKLMLPKDMNCLGQVRVCLRDIDHNHHLNNAAYLKIALEYLPQIHMITRIQITYSKSWVKNNQMWIYQKIEEDKIYYSLKNELNEEYSRIILEVER